MSCGDISAGELREGIRILSYTAAKDAIGMPVNSYSTLARTQAKIEFKVVREPKRNSRETGITGVVFTIRERSDLNSKMVIVFNDEVYNILTILKVPNPRNQFMEIKAVRASDQSIIFWEMPAPSGGLWETPTEGDYWQI
jgi:SPP1 family predicted phage head-tail adaptor